MFSYPIDEELNKSVDEKINLGESLKIRIQPFIHIDGALKIKKKVNKEIEFLDKARRTGELKHNNVQCSNLSNYECLINTLYSLKNIKYIDYPIHTTKRQSPLRIDIVCDSGSTWVKVIARNPKSLSETVQGRSRYGTRTILEQAEEFIEIAMDNECYFKPPKVIFQFAHKIDDELASDLEEIGIIVSQLSFDDSKSNNEAENSKISNFDQFKNLEKLNLDVSTMLAYVSSMTNGSTSEYSNKLLTEQSELEKINSVKEMLDKLFEGKQLICCETAIQSFNQICATVAGPNEKIRAEKFVERITVLPDAPIVDELSNLNASAKIRPRSLVIFSFGMFHKALTVTGNMSFIRSAEMQGIDIPAVLHASRALSEEKEIKL